MYRHTFVQYACVKYLEMFLLNYCMFTVLYQFFVEMYNFVPHCYGNGQHFGR